MFRPPLLKFFLLFLIVQCAIAKVIEKEGSGFEFEEIDLDGDVETTTEPPTTTKPVLIPENDAEQFVMEYLLSKDTASHENGMMASQNVSNDTDLFQMNSTYLNEEMEERNSTTLKLNQTLRRLNETDDYDTISNIVINALENFTIPVPNMVIPVVQKEDDTTSASPKNARLPTLAELLSNLLQMGYSSEVRPYFTDKKLPIDVSVYITRLHSVSEADMTFGLDLYLNEQWFDPRLQFIDNDTGEVNLPASVINTLWLPDTYFPNSVASSIADHSSVTHRHYVWLRHDGRLTYNRKLSLTVDCPMKLQLYPFDKQICRLMISSYGFTVNDVEYKWAKGRKLQLEPKLELPEFTLGGVKTRRVESHYLTGTGTFSTLEVCFVMNRNAGFCVLQLIVPSLAMVLSSWVSLWLENETQFGDIITVILALLLLSFAYNSLMPKVSYIKLLDAYLGICFIFCFLSLLKLVIVKFFRKRYARLDDSSRKKTWMGRFLRLFHVGSQLGLPAAFAVVLFFFLTIYPAVQDTEQC